MADQKISELTALTGANVADDDAIAIVDTSATETKKIVFSELKNALDTATGFVRITGDTMTGNLSMGDNVKAIFGAGSDLQIYHADLGDGSNSYIDEVGAGVLKIRSNGTGVDFESTGGETLAQFVTNGAATLYYNNAPTLATTSTGVDVTGTITSDGLTVGSATSQNSLFDSVFGSGDPNEGIVIVPSSTGKGWVGFNNGNNASIPAQFTYNFSSSLMELYSSGSLNIQTGAASRLNIASNGDISFYEDTGTTPKLTWDAAAEMLTTTGLTVAKTATISTTDYYASSTFSGTLKGAANNTKAALLLNSVSSSGQNAFASIHSEPIADFRASLIGTYSADGSGAGYFSINQFVPSSSSTLERMRISSDGSCRWTPDGTNPDMTLDASGNLLVGKTTTAFGTQGVRLSSVGTVIATSNGNAPAELNRLTLDGTILGLYKDGAPVGSIGTVSGDMYIGNGDTGMRFFDAGDAIIPTTTNGASSDAARDLGYSSIRWRNLYLSNSINITGSGDKSISLTSGTGSTSVINMGDADDIDAGQIVYDNANNSMQVKTNGEEAMRIDASGRLGLKTSANVSFDQVAGANLFVLGSGAGDQGMTIYSGNSGTGNIMFADGTTTTTQYEGYVQYVHSDNRLLFGTNHATRMTIDGTGAIYQGSGFTTGTNATRFQLGEVSLSKSSTGFQYVNLYYNPNGNVGAIAINGSSTSYITTSDYRLKENVVEMTGATDRVKQLEPKRFNFIADADTTVDGFLAHEVQAIVPEAISGEKDAVDAEGNPVYQGIDQSKLVPLLVATIKELEARITALENA